LRRGLGRQLGNRAKGKTALVGGIKRFDVRHQYRPMSLAQDVGVDPADAMRARTPAIQPCSKWPSCTQPLANAVSRPRE
jgi:hypothetical protein